MNTILYQNMKEVSSEILWNVPSVTSNLEYRETAAFVLQEREDDTAEQYGQIDKTLTKWEQEAGKLAPVAY